MAVLGRTPRRRRWWAGARARMGSCSTAVEGCEVMAEEIGEQPDGSNEPIEANQKEETAQDIADAATKTAGEIQEDAKAAKLVADDVNAVEEDGAEPKL